VLNRGGKLGLALFNDNSVVNDLVKEADAGNGFLMSRGYTVVWSGWQGDIAPGGGRLTFSPPTVPQVTGLAREEFVFDHMENPALATLSYPADDLDPAHAKLSVREREADLRAAPNGLSFKFEGPNRIAITRPAGFDAGAIYELVYLAKDPKGWASALPRRAMSCRSFAMTWLMKLATRARPVSAAPTSSDGASAKKVQGGRMT